MTSDIKLMLKIYKTVNFDWMGAEIKRVEDLTKHHIVKKEAGGANDISNYALLLPKSHQLLHFMEEHYYDEYVKLNELFQQLNYSLEPPTPEYCDQVRAIVKKVLKDQKRKRRGRSLNRKIK